MAAPQFAARLPFCLSLAIALFAAAGDAFAEADDSYHFVNEPGRHALVIGNWDYQNLPKIQSAQVDADKIAAKLRDELGFEVRQEPNVKSWDEMNQILPSFIQTVKKGDFILFYFSGHGFTYGTNNFLVPTEMKADLAAEEVGDNAISAEAVEKYFRQYKPGFVLFLLDSCRAIPNLLHIREHNADTATVPKAFSPNRQIGENINTLISYATRVSTEAGGSSDPKENSPYTKGLLLHVADEDQELDKVLKRVRSEVLKLTQNKQGAEMSVLSTADVFLKPTQKTLNEQLELWNADLQSDQPGIRIAEYLEQYPLSPYAAAAIKWLEDHPKSQVATAYTQASPPEIDNAWDRSKQVISVERPGSSVGFERTLDVSEKPALYGLSNSDFEAVEQSPARAAPSLSEAQWSRFVSSAAIAAHPSIVLTQQTISRSAAAAGASVATSLPVGSRVEVQNTETHDNKLWIVGTVGNNKQHVYVPLNEGNNLPALQLGTALREVIIPPRRNSIAALADADTIAKELDDLHAQHDTITWVSIATAKSDDPKEARLRVARATDAKYILTQAGINPLQITGVIGTNDFSDDGVRLRIFGY